MDFCFQIWPVAGPSGYILASRQQAGITEHTKAKGNPYVSCCFFFFLMLGCVVHSVE
jgi:hypothetical protein